MTSDRELRRDMSPADAAGELVARKTAERAEVAQTDPYTFTSRVKSVEDGKNFPDDAPYTIHLENGASIRLSWDAREDVELARREGTWIMTCPFEYHGRGELKVNEQMRHAVILDPVNPQPSSFGVGVHLIDLPEKS